MPVKFEFGDYLKKEMIPFYICDEIERFIYEKNNNISEADYTFRNVHALIGLAKYNNRIDDKVAYEIRCSLNKMNS